MLIRTPLLEISAHVLQNKKNRNFCACTQKNPFLYWYSAHQNPTMVRRNFHIILIVIRNFCAYRPTQKITYLLRDLRICANNPALEDLIIQCQYWEFLRMYAKNTTSLLRFGASVNAQNLTMVRSSYFAHLNGILLVVMGISAHVGKNFYVTVG